MSGARLGGSPASRRSSGRSSRSSWLLFSLCLAAIYASLPFVRGVVIALRSQHLLSLAVTLMFFVAGVAVAYYVVFDVRLSDRVAFFALALLAGAVGSLILGLSIPEERVHFLEYGLLAVLARHALSGHMGPRRQYFLALTITTAAGLVDELLQGVIPDRVFDWRDVAINGVAALLALAGDEVLHNRLRWRSE
jgi:hypothetical protein